MIPRSSSRHKSASPTITLGSEGQDTLPLSFGIPRHLVTVMIAIVPVMLLTPSAFVLIPPAVMFPPAAVPRLTQLAPLVICLTAVAPVVLNGFVKIMLSVLDAPLTLFLGFCMSTRDSREQNQRRANR